MQAGLVMHYVGHAGLLGDHQQLVAGLAEILDPVLAGQDVGNTRAIDGMLAGMGKCSLISSPGPEIQIATSRS